MKVYKIVLMMLSCVGVVSTTWTASLPAEPTFRVTFDNQTESNVKVLYCTSSSPKQGPIDCLNKKGSIYDVDPGKHTGYHIYIYGYNTTTQSKLLRYTRLFFSKEADNFNQNVTSVLFPQNATKLCKTSEGIVFTITEDPKNPDKLKVTDNCSITGRVQKAWTTTTEKVPKLSTKKQQTGLQQEASAATGAPKRSTMGSKIRSVPSKIKKAFKGKPEPESSYYYEE